MIAQLQMRRGTNALWTSANPTLAAGEIGWTTDAPFLLKIGDGATNWVGLRSFAIPDGGTTGQALVKASGTSRDLTWGTRSTPAVQTILDTPQNATAWNKPSGCTTVLMQVMGNGGGGGSGARGLTSAIRYGGGGGQAGSLTNFMFEAADLPATVYATIGAAGTGGVAQTVDSTAGNNGTNGDPAFVSLSNSATLATAAEQAIALGSGGQFGAGGLITTAPSAQTRNDTGFITGGLGALASQTTANQPFQGGGGAGAGLTAANAIVGSGSFGAAFGKGVYARAGVTSPAAGAAGLAGSTSTGRIANVVAPGTGGSGGNAQTPSGVGGVGGAGDRGGGGGGGAASSNASNSGAGGAGGVGFVIITAYF